MVKRKKKSIYEKLEGNREKGLGSISDSFYLAHRWLKQMGKGIGLSKKRNELLKTEIEMQRKLHKSHSGLRRLIRFKNKFERKAYLDTKISTIKKRMK